MAYVELPSTNTEFECLDCGWHGYLRNMPTTQANAMGALNCNCPKCEAILFDLAWRPGQVVVYGELEE